MTEEGNSANGMATDSSGHDMTETEFIEAYKPQFLSSGVPEHLWKMVFQKITEDVCTIIIMSYKNYNWLLILFFTLYCVEFLLPPPKKNKETKTQKKNNLQKQLGKTLQCQLGPVSGRRRTVLRTAYVVNFQLHVGDLDF